MWLNEATCPYYVSYSSYTVNAFRVQVENGLENVLFLHFSLVSIHFVVHTGGYAVIQVKHQRDINLKLCFFNLLGAGFLSVLQFLAYL